MEGVLQRERCAKRAQKHQKRQKYVKQLHALNGESSGNDDDDDTFHQTGAGKVKSADASKLTRVYYDEGNPAGFGGVEKLHSATAIPRSAIKEWITFQDTATLHKQVKRVFPRLKI